MSVSKAHPLFLAGSRANRSGWFRRAGRVVRIWLYAYLSDGLDWRGMLNLRLPVRRLLDAVQLLSQSKRLVFPVDGAALLVDESE